MKECPTNQYHSSSSAPQRQHVPVHHPSQQISEQSYEFKFNQLRAYVAQLECDTTQRIQEIKPSDVPVQKCLVAFDDHKWVESDASDAEEETEVNTCYMAIEEGNSSLIRHVSKNDIESGKWVDVVLKKVNDHCKLSDENERTNLFWSIHLDLTFVSTTCSKAIKLAGTSSSELVSLSTQISEIPKLKGELINQISTTTILSKEKDELLKRLHDEEKIMKTWSRASILTKELSEQIPLQSKAILGGDLAKAMLIPEVLKIESEMEKLKANGTKVPFDYQKFKKKVGYTPESEGDDGYDYSKYIAGPSILGPHPKQGQSSNGKAPMPNQRKNAPKTKTNAKPIEKSKSSAKVESDVLMRMERQIEALSRQVQSCTAIVHQSKEKSAPPKAKAKPVKKVVVVSEKAESENVENVLPKPSRRHRKRKVVKLSNFVPEIKATTSVPET